MGLTKKTFFTDGLMEEIGFERVDHALGYYYRFLHEDADDSGAADFRFKPHDGELHCSLGDDKVGFLFEIINSLNRLSHLIDGVYDKSLRIDD